jgi:hypothetical protein
MIGDDTSFITDFSVPGSPTEPISPVLYQTPDVTVDPSLYDIQYGAPGVAPTAGTYEAAAAGDTSNSWLSKIFSGIATAVPKLNLPPGPANRVSVPVAPPFTTGIMASSIIRGIPDIAIYGIGAVILFSAVGGLMSGGRRR